MLYHFLRYFNWLFIICGSKKPFPMSSGQQNQIKIYNQCCSLLLLTIYIAFYVFRPSIMFGLGEKRYYFGIFGSINDLVLNVMVFLIDILRGDKYCKEIYKIIETILKKLNIKENILMYFAVKIYIWLGTPIVLLLCFILTELMRNAAVKITIVRAPITIALLHLNLHLIFLIAILNSVNTKLTRKLKPRDKYRLFATNEEISGDSKKKQLKYFIEGNIYFMTNDGDLADNLDMKDVSLIYYDICRCLKLLEKQHGLQVLCDIWLNFTDGVILVCILSAENVNTIPWFLLIRWLQPYIWHIGLAWLNDQIRQEVERTDTLLMKSTIDYRNDKLVSNILDSFSAQLRSNRLKFRACDLFYIDYATILGTFVSVVTYSIIVIQLFVEDEHT